MRLRERLTLAPGELDRQQNRQQESPWAPSSYDKCVVTSIEADTPRRSVTLL